VARAAAAPAVLDLAVLLLAPRRDGGREWCPARLVAKLAEHVVKCAPSHLAQAAAAAAGASAGAASAPPGASSGAFDGRPNGSGGDDGRAVALAAVADGLARCAVVASLGFQAFDGLALLQVRLPF
jgi:hypothetical protein